jgi:Glutamine amidotransferase domain
LCGIIGVASSEGMKNRSERQHFMKMGLDIDSWRGWESTGLALVPNASKEAPIIYKRALNGRDFIQLRKVEKYLDDLDKYSVAIGHNRAATTGRGNIIDHNAHPFQYGNITLVHNGHIRNTNELKGAQEGAQCLVDSAHVAYSMNANGEKETLEQLEGGFVFVWWNSDNSTLNVARNTERPLHWAFAAKENTLYWASEHTALLHLMKGIDIDEEIGILYPAPWNWYQFNLKDLREFTKTPFVKSQGRRLNRNTQTGHGSVTYRQGGASEGPKPTLATTPTSLTAISDPKEIEDISQLVANQRLKDVKHVGIPTSKKRIDRAKEELKKLGLDFEALRNCTPIAWTKYRNQDNLGSVLARTKQEGYLIEVLQVRNEKYLEYHAAGALLVNCVNVRNGPSNGDIRVIGIVSHRNEAFLKRRIELINNPPSSDEELIIRDHDGPDGEKITKAKFLELTRRGCAGCNGDLEPKMHGAIVWVGRSPPSPICPDCAADAGVMELLGIAQEHNRYTAGNVH